MTPKALIRGLCMVGALLLPAARILADPFINEINAANAGVLLNSAGILSGTDDVDGNSSDWIELRNPDGVAADLTGWALSDDPSVPGKWIFPAVSISAGGYLLVFASGKDRAIATVQLHTNFKLGKSGSVVLSRPNGSGGWITISGLIDYPSQKPRFSYGYLGIPGSGGTLGYFETQTPNAANSAVQVTSFVADTSCNIDRGFYSTSQNVVMTTPTPGATLIYTLDGSEPTALNGIQVPAPNGSTPPSANVTISTTTCLRVRAIKSGLGATNVDSQSYLFSGAVMQQSGPPIASLNWGSSGPDWAMDPDVTNHSDPESRCVESDLKAIPTVSISMNWNDLFGGSAAIYPPASGVANEGVQRRISIEYINPNGDKVNPNQGTGFHEDGVMEIFGGSSPTRWNSDKLSFKVGFISDLSYNLYGDDGTSNFDNMVLDARYNNVWNYGGSSGAESQRTRSDYYGDAFTGDLQRYMGGYGPHAKAVHVYLNGLYWGMYIMHERTDEHFAAAYQGGSDDEWDVVKHGKNASNFLVAGKIIDPTKPSSNTNHTAGVNYQALLTLAAADLTVTANYNAVAAKLDLEDFINYMLMNFYVGNSDWSHHNWYASYHRTDPNAKWHYHSWDAEHIMESITYDATTDDGGGSTVGGPGYLYQRLKSNTEFKLLFADIAHRHFFNNGLLSNPRVWQLFDDRMQTFSEALRAESARWGDNRAALRPSPLTGVPYLRGAEWFGQRSFWQNTFFPARSNTSGTAASGSVLGQLKSRSLYPSVAAPVFSQFGGTVPANYNLTMTNPGGAGNIYFTTDGSDPRTPVSGTPSPSAAIYSSGVTLPVSRTVKARVLNGATWSAVNAAYFSVGTVPAAAGNLVISKIHYRPGAPTSAEIAAGYTSRTDFEFVELLNISNNKVDLAGISFSQGLDVSLISGGVRELSPGQRALFVANKSAFEFRYGTGLPIAGVFILDSNLANEGETLTLLAANNSTIVSFTYDDHAPWPENPDGNGPSLVLMSPSTSNPTLAESWRSSTTTNGAPAQDDRLLFAAWQTANFPGGGPNALAGADPDNDGIPNVLEFGLGTNPNLANSPAVLPSIGVQTVDTGVSIQDYIVFSFRHVKAAEELTFSAQASTDLSSWTSTVSGLVPLDAPQDNGDGTETRSYRSPQPIGVEAERYFRVQVQGP